MRFLKLRRVLRGLLPKQERIDELFKRHYKAFSAKYDKGLEPAYVKYL